MENNISLFVGYPFWPQITPDRTKALVFLSSITDTLHVKRYKVVYIPFIYKNYNRTYKVTIE